MNLTNRLNRLEEHGKRLELTRYAGIMEEAGKSAIAKTRAALEALHATTPLELTAEQERAWSDELRAMLTQKADKRGAYL